MSLTDRFLKRLFDICGAACGLLIAWPVILLAVLVARIDTKASGLFRQMRVGRDGRLFCLLKIRTMRDIAGVTTTVTTREDCRITRIGSFFRRSKIDELPQLWNVLRGDMSFVGPRPDVPQQMAELSEEDRIILSIRPGITGPASLKYREEEQLLASQADPERYNSEVIFPDKVRINRFYIEEYRFSRDLWYLWLTVSGANFPEQSRDTPHASSSILEHASRPLLVRK